MKILFLDIDGVLNSHSSRVQANAIRAGDFGTHRAWIPECVAQLRRILLETNCNIVISSDWRLPHNISDLKKGFDFFALPDWIGVTPIIKREYSTAWNDGYNRSYRGEEIKQWLANNPQVTSFAIVDDNPWMLPIQAPYFIRTNEDTGMTHSDADQLIRILNRACS